MAVDNLLFVEALQLQWVGAEIHLGTRSILEYLLSPVQRAFHEAAQER